MVKDWTYVAAFKRKDLPSLQRMTQHIRETHDTDMIENINQRFEDRSQSLNNDIKILDVGRTDDLVVTTGLQQCVNMILGTSSTRWTYIGIGNGLGAAAITDTGLVTEAPTRLSMAVLGWAEPRGMKLFFGAVVPETTNITTVFEVGVFNAAAVGTGIMLNRNQFNSNLINRSVGTAVFIISSVVEFCPVA